MWFICHVGRRIREKLAASTDDIDRPRPECCAPFTNR
jgi:hypothetical protein